MQMWQDMEKDPLPSSSFFPAPEPEPSSPQLTATLPSSTVPTTFSARPTYAIGTKSHSYATEHRKSPPHAPLALAAFLPEADHSVVMTPTPPTPTSPSLHSANRGPSLHRKKSSSSTAESVQKTLSRQSSLSHGLNRHSSLSKKQPQSRQTQDRDLTVPPSPSSTHRPQKHVMLNRRSTSQDFQLRLQQQQQRQGDLGDELSEAGEDHVPGTPTSISSFGSGTMALSGSERDREKSVTTRDKRLSRSSVALIESRNIQTLSSNLAMVSSPTDNEFPQHNSEALLSVIAQKEARIAQLREDLEVNLSELTQLKEQWSQIMIEERNRLQAEANASIQEQGRQLGGHGSSQSVSHRLSTTGAGIWGTVVGSVSGISGVSGGISLHNINTLHQQQHQQQTMSPQASTASGGPVSDRSSTSSYTGRGESQGLSGSSRPTSPLPAYLSNFSSLNGLNTPVSPVGNGTSHGPASVRRGDRASLSSLSTCSSSLSNAGDGSTAFEAGHSSQSSFSSAGHPDQNAPQLQSYKEQQEARRHRRESSGLFIPPEAEEVLVNTGRALFKGFGSLIGGIRTVVSDVAESDRFQHSRQRTIDMVSGLAQTAADALPLPSHDDIYYHHQRLRLLEDGGEEGLLLGLEQQQANEQQRQDRIKGKGDQVLERGQRLDSSKGQAKNSMDGLQEAGRGSLSRTISQLSIREETESSITVSSLSAAQDQEEEEEVEEGEEWNIEDKELLESLEADVQLQSQNTIGTDKSRSIESRIDTPARNTLESTTTAFTLASKKND
ncbi:hypothetical protein BG011_007217 [Mortierella polycephala]|uniref:Uncharacterized protein n=1 Tax=Mortierella polycephala TaxID=41804 RepID=A0A9P6PSJ5_9FUNG|nr:hypothetical protein BG011_007217 [Mortierella polycephala]